MNKLLFILVLLLWSNVCASREGNHEKSQREIREAHNHLLKKNDAFVTDNRGKIFSQELAPFNLTIDSLEQTVLQLVKSYEARMEEIDARLIDSLLTETKFKHRRYRLLYPNNYHRFADFKKKATVPEDYFKHVMEGSFDNPSMVEFKEYKRCVNYYFDILY